MFRLFLAVATGIAVSLAGLNAAAQEVPPRAGQAATVGPMRKEISVASAQSLALTEESEWAPLPPYLRGATMFRPAGNALDLTAKEEVQVLIAASWTYDGDQTGGWYPGRTSLAQLMAQGWEPVGIVGHKTSGLHRVLRRTLKAGDHVKFHTRKFNPPVAILVAADKAAMVSKLLPQSVRTNDLTGIRPPAAAFATPGAKAVLLRTHEADREDYFADRGLLLRELVRQAVLLAARDELGQATRDETLRERWGERADGGPLPLDIIVHVQDGGRTSITLCRISGGKPEVLFDRELSLDDPDLVLPMLKIAESFSREDFPAALRKAGFDGKANAVKDDLAVPADVEELLSQLHWLPQLDAARRLHRAIKEEGESPQRLAALAQAYAQLGVLTEHLWYPGHKAYKARALLYAERGMVLWPMSAESRHGRALVRSLLGLHAAALEDLAADGDAAGAKPPPWKAAAEALCRFDMPALDGLCEKKSAALPRLLRVQAVGRFGTNSSIVSSVQSLLESVPDSDWAMDFLSMTGEFGNRQVAASEGPQRMAERLYARVKGIGGLPGAVDAVVGSELTARENGDEPGGEIRRRVELVRAFRSAGEIGRDAGEPSWQAFGTLIEEVSFYHTFRQLDFLASSLAVPLDSTRTVLEPLVQDHPYRGMIAALCDDQKERELQLRKLSTTVRPQDITLNEYYMLGFFSNYDLKRQFELLGGLAMTHTDYVYGDLLTTVAHSQGHNVKDSAARLRRVSPHSPHTISITISHDWDYSAPHAAEWETQFASSPRVLLALGQQYLQHEKLDDATRCLERAITLSPDFESYKLLADAWLKQKDEKKWLEVWEKYLKQEEFGLTHASVRVGIAQHYMNTGRFEKALPYSQQAAATWAEWAMESAANCLTGLKRYDEAEEYWRRMAGRYVPTCYKWYYWCRKTGQGNVDEARTFVRNAINDNFGGVDLTNRAIFLTLEGDKEGALKAYDESFAADRYPEEYWAAALVADELQRPEKRDAYLQLAVRTADRPGYTRKFMVELTTLAQDALADPTRMADSAAKAEKLVMGLQSVDERSTAGWVAGKFYDLHGQPVGVKLMKECARLHYVSAFSTLAAAELRSRKIELDDAKK
jgi:tetratricopeptide (TPR) repeat protein